MLKGVSAFLAFSVSALSLSPTFSEPVPVPVTEVSAKLLVKKADGSESAIPLVWTDRDGSNLPEATPIGLSQKEFDLNSTYRIEITTSTSWVPNSLREKVGNTSWTTVTISAQHHVIGPDEGLMMRTNPSVPGPTPGTTQTTQVFSPPPDSGFGIKEEEVSLVLPVRASGGFLGLRYRGIDTGEGILTGNGSDGSSFKKKEKKPFFFGAEGKGCGVLKTSRGNPSEMPQALVLLVLVCFTCILALALEHRRNDNKA